MTRSTTEIIIHQKNGLIFEPQMQQVSLTVVHTAPRQRITGAHCGILRVLPKKPEANAGVVVCTIQRRARQRHAGVPCANIVLLLQSIKQPRFPLRRPVAMLLTSSLLFNPIFRFTFSRVEVWIAPERKKPAQLKRVQVTEVQSREEEKSSLVGQFTIQDSRLLYYLVREIKPWLNINHIAGHSTTYFIF